MAIYQFGDERPVVSESAWVADSAQVMGRVTLADGASIWYGAVLRGPFTLAARKAAAFTDIELAWLESGA